MKEVNEDGHLVITIVMPAWFPPVLHAITKYDSKTGFCYRIDPQNDGASTKRHIHIWKKNKPHKEVSWNIDGSRHDKRKFDENIEGFRHAKELANRMLEPASGVKFNLQQKNVIDEIYNNLIVLLAYAIANDTAIKSITIDYNS